MFVFVFLYSFSRSHFVQPLSDHIMIASYTLQVASARTFEFTGSSFMLVGTGSRSTAEALASLQDLFYLISLSQYHLIIYKYPLYLLHIYIL